MKAFQDFSNSLTNWRIWLTLAIQDIKLRYKRSTLGPFWITISMAITIYSMGFLYGHLMRINIQEYFPYLAASIIGWNLIATLINESTNIFIESENYIKNTNLPYSVYVIRLVIRNLIIFAHNLIVFIPIIFLFDIKITWHLLIIIPGLIFLAINAVTIGALLGFIGTRYRDVGQIVGSLIQVIFFVTPIMWMPSLLPEKYQYLVIYNPFNELLNLVRNPLINKELTEFNIIYITSFTLIGIIIYAFSFEKLRNKLAFWL